MIAKKLRLAQDFICDDRTLDLFAMMDFDEECFAFASFLSAILRRE